MLLPQVSERLLAANGLDQDVLAQQLRQSGRGLSPKALAQVQLELAQLRRKRPTAEPDESPAPPFDPTEYARLAAN